MKFLSAIPLTLLVMGCVSTAEFDRDRAYSECENISDKSSRDRCIADVIQKAERERAGWKEDMEQDEKDADQRELNRVIAGVEQD